MLEKDETELTSTKPMSKSAETKGEDTAEPSGVDLSEANMGQLGSVQKSQLLALLSDLNDAGLFAVDPKRVKGARGEPLRLRLKDSTCRLFTAGTWRYSPE